MQCASIVFSLQVKMFIWRLLAILIYRLKYELSKSQPEVSEVHFKRRAINNLLGYNNEPWHPIVFEVRARQSTWPLNPWNFFITEHLVINETEARQKVPMGMFSQPYIPYQNSVYNFGNQLASRYFFSKRSAELRKKKKNHPQNKSTSWSIHSIKWNLENCNRNYRVKDMKSEGRV